MPTQCATKPLEFEPNQRRRVVAAFDGGPITSDAGLLLLRRVDRRLALSDQVADCFTDHRDPKRVHYSLRKLIAQRIVGIAQGYEDLIDHDQLRHDPLMALVSEKGRRPDSPSLAGKSTLNRLEHAPTQGPGRHHKIDHDPEALQARWQRCRCFRGKMPPEGPPTGSNACAEGLCQPIQPPTLLNSASKASRAPFIALLRTLVRIAA